MKRNNNFKDDFAVDIPIKQNTVDDSVQPFSNKVSKPMIAGILLITVGILASFLWILSFTVDIATIESTIDLSQLQELDPTITPEKIKEFLVICGTIGLVIAIFSVLAGVLALKRKFWRIAIAGGIPQVILGFFTPVYSLLFVVTILTLIALILIAFSKKEFQ